MELGVATIMSHLFDDETADAIIREAAKLGIKCPKEENALKLCSAALNGAMAVANLDEPSQGEFAVDVCRRGCCVNYTVSPEHIQFGAQLISTLKSEEEAIRYLKHHSFQIIGLMAMN